jgi:hypothetical protein
LGFRIQNSELPLTFRFMAAARPRSEPRVRRPAMDSAGNGCVRNNN